ncbi:P-loop containing nucleoside triphosphate hydrolase protein [Hypoxylon trugodes]|uniref:P-loop containing nucleoside triphosphate hydrolase protein n=1 Tax=Hypoxylon trugodes TaxID=326681 RepID=UPI00219A9857|nr:P-loop containing nucleoside triphosphate hydrolase protein [Hypoxylon trugodes]KAI1382659.1 P-loop containing nucleoside triphosphate hydrolase protein [Hypoxylon trugodes]
MAKKKKSKGARPPPPQGIQTPNTRPPQITPPREASPPHSISQPTQIKPQQATPPRNITPPREPTPPRDPTPPRAPSPPRVATPPREATPAPSTVPELYHATEEPLPPSPEPREYSQTEDNYANYRTAEEVPEDWHNGFDDKESQVALIDSSLTRFSFEDSDHVTSEVPAADFKAGSTHSADEGYEHVSSEPQQFTEDQPQPTTEDQTLVEEQAPIEEDPTQELPAEELLLEEPFKEQVFDFQQYDQLPRISPPNKHLRPHNVFKFDLEALVGAIQNGYSAAELRDYLSYYQKVDDALLKENLNAEVSGFPAIFFIAETNDAELLRLWIKYGGDPNATHGPFDFPLLAFAILRGSRSRLEATKVTETLLRLGASAPLSIPVVYYLPYNRDLSEFGPREEDIPEIAEGQKLWCTPEIRSKLVTALSLTQRYRLWQATFLEPASGRQRTLALRKDAEEVLGLQQTIIGQRLAAWSLTKSFLVHLAMPSKKPLVLIFAGPKGHGERQLAKRLSNLLSLELQYVDYAQLESDDELFGPKSPAEGYEFGSPLNNFLAEKTGQRSIVYIDGFDKTSEEVHKTLLIPFDRGEYIDRRNGEKIDCSQTIWILVTSKFDDIIDENDNLLRDFDQRSQHDVVRRQLSRSLRGEYIASFGAPLASRITETIPFLTFSENERAIIADRCIMELETVIAAPAVISENPDEDKPVGNVQLQIVNNASVCSIIANEYYLPELGADSIARGVDAAIANPVVGQYLEGDDFGEDQAETRFTVGTNEENEVEVLPVPTNTDYPNDLGSRYY